MIRLRVKLLACIRPRSVWGRVVALVAACALAPIARASLAGAGAPPRGSEAPPIVLHDLEGTEVRTRDLAPRALVLLFGEFGHETVERSAAEVLDAVADPRVEHGSVVPLMIVAQDADVAMLKDAASRARYPAIILHDPRREAFGAYRVLVLPTVVVVDGRGTVVHSLPGFLPRFREVLALAIQVATGKAEMAQLDRAIDPGTAPAPSPESVRATRLTRLGSELVRHGLYDMAEARFAEAIAIAPDHVEARLGLGELLLQRDRAADAEPLFRSILTTHPDSVEARLGLAAVHVGGSEEGLGAAETSLREILDRHPDNPRAHYLMGRTQERLGRPDEALASYRRAAELLLRR